MELVASTVIDIPGRGSSHMDDQDSESPQLQKLELTLDPENLKDKRHRN